MLNIKYISNASLFGVQSDLDESIGPFLYGTRAGNALTVMGEHYRNMIIYFFESQLKDIALKTCGFSWTVRLAIPPVKHSRSCTIFFSSLSSHVLVTKIGS